MMSNENKEKLCIKYKSILELIGVINKGYILQKQLIELMLPLGIVENTYQARKSIGELEDAQIIKKINFMDTKNKIIMLKKYGIRFLESKKGSGSVGAIRTSTTNQRYYRSIFLNHYIIRLLENSNYAKYAKEHGLQGLLKAIHSNISAGSLNYYQGYLNSLELNQSALQSHISILEGQKKQKEQAFIKSSKNRVGANTEHIKPKKKKSAKERREDLLFNSTLETLKKKDCYLSSHNKKTNTWEFIFIDVLNNQNIKKIIENIALIFFTLNDLNNTEFKVNIRILSWDSIGKEKIINDLNKDMYRVLRDTYKITDTNWLESITVINVNMNENYLGNIIKLQY